MRASRLSLGLLSVGFLLLAVGLVPRLTNCLWSDVEFTGWVAPFAQRILSGEHLYRDFTLPISPASFALMALVQKVLGRAWLIDELWLCALCNLGMALLAYAIARPFTDERNAAWVSIATLPLLISSPKEIAYDQTAQLMAWSSVACLAQGLLRNRRAALWLAGAGLFSSLSLAFKSSTGLGACGGLALAFALMLGLSWRRQGREKALVLLRQGGWMTAGLGLGLLVMLGLVLGLGGELKEFYRTVFVDGPALKGGQGKALLNLISYTLIQSPIHLSLMTSVLLALLATRLQPARCEIAREQLEELVPSPAQSRRYLVLTSLVLVGVFGSAIWMLRANVLRTPAWLQALAGLGLLPSMLGLLFAVFLWIHHVRVCRGLADRQRAFVAVGLMSLVISLMHNLSHPTLRLFYDPNPIIPVAILALWLALDGSRVRGVKPYVFCLMALTLFGPKFQRYLDARHPVDDPGFWRGMQVSDNGMVLLGAAQRARELAGPEGTVLMLPEDPMFEALIGRPRPQLRGGVVFVDQYPVHVFQKDWARLRDQLPSVVLIHPREPGSWNRMYATWSSKSPAAALQMRFMQQLLGEHYQLDSSYPTRMFQEPGVLDLYVRKAEN